MTDRVDLAHLKALASEAAEYGWPPDHKALSEFVIVNLPQILRALAAYEKVMDEDWLSERISDSLDVDWRPIDCARGIIAALGEEG